MASLRDVSGVKQPAGLPELMRRRECHVVTENARMLQAVKATKTKILAR